MQIPALTLESRLAIIAWVIVAAGLIAANLLPITNTYYKSSAWTFDEQKYGWPMTALTREVHQFARDDDNGPRHKPRWCCDSLPSGREQGIEAQWSMLGVHANLLAGLIVLACTWFVFWKHRTLFVRPRFSLWAFLVAATLLPIVGLFVMLELSMSQDSGQDWILAHELSYNPLRFVLQTRSYPLPIRIPLLIGMYCVAHSLAALPFLLFARTRQHSTTRNIP